MLVPVTAFSDSLPSDLAQYEASLRVVAPDAGRPPMVFGDTTEESAAVVVAPPLDRWVIQAHVYTTEVAGKLSFLGGLLGGGAKRASAGAMDEAKRFRLTEVAGKQVEIGVAVRLVAAITSWEANLDVSIPNIAAAAQ